MDNGAKLQPKAPMPEAPKAPIYAAKPKKRRKAASLDKRKARSGWLFVLPFILGLVLVYFPVIFDSLRYSFSSMTLGTDTGYVIEFAGIENYQEALFRDPDFVRTLVTGFRGLLIDIPAIVIFSLFIAVVLNQKMLGRAVFRTIFFIPVICATGIMGSVAAATNGIEQMGSEGINTGAIDDGGFSINADKISQIFASMKIGTELAGYVVGWVNGIAGIIQRCGVQMLIFLAALQSISPAIYESCSIDGATTWETFWKITLPMISPMILVNAIYTVIDSFTSDSNIIMKYIVEKFNEADGMTLSAAMAWIYFAIIILIVLVVFGLLKAFIFYQRRD